ncbi:MAG: nucleotide exchange factor GrpE [bacterium]|nr:nucleotide exchange factor GrpE [bacterium]
MSSHHKQPPPNEKKEGSPPIIEDGATKKIEQLEKDLQESHDKSLRLMADMDNLRKRMAREKEEILRYGTEKLLMELLHVKDSLESALKHSEEAHDPKMLRDGIVLTEKQLDQALEKAGLTPIKAIGEPFDPALHEAIGQEVSQHFEPGTVVHEFQKGYLFHERLLRPARVTVAGEPSEPSDETSE